MLSLVTIGAIASKNASDSSPVISISELLNELDVRGPVDMITLLHFL